MLACSFDLLENLALQLIGFKYVNGSNAIWHSGMWPWGRLGRVLCRYNGLFILSGIDARICRIVMERTRGDQGGEL